jgi:hypothetical protein
MMMKETKVIIITSAIIILMWSIFIIITIK